MGVTAAQSLASVNYRSLSGTSLQNHRGWLWLPPLYGRARLRSSDPVTTIVPDGKVHKFEARNQQFFIDGQPTLIVSGKEMHFGRVQPEDWDTRIKQAKRYGPEYH